MSLRLFHYPDGLRGKLLKLTGPIFLETFLILLLGVVDTLMLSHYSDNAVAAVGVVNQLLNMVFLLFNVTAVGTSVMCALYFGARDSKSFTQVIGVSLLFNALIGLLISLLLSFGGKQMLIWMDIRPDLMPMAISYMKIEWFSFHILDLCHLEHKYLLNRSYSIHMSRITTKESHSPFRTNCFQGNPNHAISPQRYDFNQTENVE